MPGVLGGVGGWQRPACCSLKAVGRSSQQSNRWIGGVWLAAGLGSQFNASLPVRARTPWHAWLLQRSGAWPSASWTMCWSTHRQAAPSTRHRCDAAPRFLSLGCALLFTGLCASGSGLNTSATGLVLPLGWVVLQRSGLGGTAAQRLGLLRPSKPRPSFGSWPTLLMLLPTGQCCAAPAPHPQPPITLPPPQCHKKLMSASPLHPPCRCCRCCCRAAPTATSTCASARSTAWAALRSTGEHRGAGAAVSCRQQDHCTWVGCGWS